MKLLIIANKSQLDSWISEQIRNDCEVMPVKGSAPEGATYSNGDPIDKPIPIAWKNVTTGDVFLIDYELIGA